MSRGGPVSVGKVDVSKRKGSRDKGRVVWVELPLDPVWPDPVQVVLNGFRVDKAAGMENYSGPQELDGFLYLRRLGKAPKPGQNGQRIDDPVRPGGSFDEKSPWKPASQHAKKDTTSAKKTKPERGNWCGRPAGAACRQRGADEGGHPSGHPAQAGGGALVLPAGGER